MADHDVVVIGAGCGGITAGALLARQGRSVLVLEQSADIGGCCQTFEKDGFHFDLGASLAEVISPIEMAFRMLGTTFREEVELIPCEPVMSFVFKDGSQVTYPTSIEGTAEAIAGLSPRDAEGWLRYAEYFSEMFRTTIGGFFVSPADTLADMVRITAASPRILKYLPLFGKSYEEVITSYFKNDKVQQTMASQSLYIGLPPELTPGIFATIPYSEHEGIYYPRGGMGRIPCTLCRIGREHGMEVQTGRLVKKVIVRKRRAHGVVLSDGTEITSDLVVSDVNARTLYLEMIGEEHLPWLARVGIRSYELSKPTPMINVGVDYEPPLEAHHTVIAASFPEMNDYWWRYYKKGIMPEEPFGVICWPTKADPSLAPEGHHVVNIIPESMYRLSGSDWDREKEPFIERTIQALSKRIIPGLADHVVTVECSTPLDFERRLLMPEGAIYDLQQDLTSQTVFRPSARSRSIKGLYLVGNSTHPGGGVPLVIASGCIAANLIDKYE